MCILKVILHLEILAWGKGGPDWGNRRFPSVPFIPGSEEVRTAPNCPDFFVVIAERGEGPVGGELDGALRPGLHARIFRLQGNGLNANSSSMNISRNIVINGWWWAR